jgi:lipid II:glycine glycyltransferase (peptidoglycan interpeptide bridge formation enzyme)
MSSPAPAPAAAPTSTIAAAPAADAAPAMRVTWARALSPADARDFDAFVAGAAGGHFAQTRAWSAVACAERPFAARYVIVRDGADGVILGAAHLLRARVAGVPLPYAVVERGPVVDRPELFRPVLAALSRAARRRGIVRLGVMPYWTVDAGGAIAQALADAGWRSVQTVAGAHAVTLRLEAAGRDDEALFAGGDRLKLRQKIRQAERDGATVRRGSVADMPLFVELHGALMAEQGMHVKSAAWSRAMGGLGFGPDGPGALFFTEHDGQTVSGALVIRHGRYVTLYMCASARAERKFSKMVPSVVAAIRWARDVGCDFDFGGVPMDGDSDEKRLSIAQFKRDFVKTRVPLLGQHARWLP